jgi:predicted dehydrogenase
MKNRSRRSFLKTSLGGTAGLVLLSSCRLGTGRRAMHNGKIQVAQIGCGREGTVDMKGVMAHPLCRVVAVCDLDSKRAETARQTVVDFYAKNGQPAGEVKVYHDFHEVLARPDIDGVVVSTPDHWHALVATAGALAGKHMYVQKPLTYCITEAIALRTAVKAKGVIVQAGSQQRSEHPFAAFRASSEAVRNGKIGRLKTIRIGIGLDRPRGHVPAAMPVPPNLDYETWLGPAPQQDYMEERVHPQQGYGRPGWITTEDFGLGMITNWGAHHIDIAQWAMGMELSGPRTIQGTAAFMYNDVWTVHTSYHVEMEYANGVQVILDNKYENGLRFEGTDGWTFCSRGSVKVTSSDGNAGEPEDTRGPLRASDPKVLTPVGEGGIRWPASSNHYLNWLESVAANRTPIAPVDQAARSLEACATAWIAMKLGRKLTWDPAAEAFVGDDQANAMRMREPRKPEYDVRVILKQAGLA